MKSRILPCITVMTLLAALALVVRPAAQQTTSGTDDVQGESATFPAIFVRDVVVSNTNRHLQNTDVFKNSEPGIAINPRHPDQIVISAFSGGWALPDGSPSNSPLWYSKSGGAVWTKVFSIPPPNKVPGVSASPCDQTFDYDRDGKLYGTFLVDPAGLTGECSKLQANIAEEEGAGNEIYSGATTDPANPSAWKWFLDETGTAQTTSPLGVDQPWLIAAPDAGDLTRDKIYVAYQGLGSLDLRVAAADATVPPNFPLDELAGFSNPGQVNPGHRAAADPRTGAVYTLYSDQIGRCDTPEPLFGGVELEYKVNRSTDGGRTWSFGNQPLGAVVAQACSDQNTHAFGYSFGVPEPENPLGKVNSLKGGIHALAVDPEDGAVYVVYGAFDDELERDQLKIVRVTSDGGDVKIGNPVLVSQPADRQSALPAVAVTENGTVGVLYDTADGLVGDSEIPTFSAHLAVSRDHGETFFDSIILKFRSPVPTGGRILGDYQQLKAVGNTFYGVFSGNGHDLRFPFNRKTEAIDPIFFKSTVR